jgi:hypothetical protein
MITAGGVMHYIIDMLLVLRHVASNINISQNEKYQDV